DSAIRASADSTALVAGCRAAGAEVLAAITTNSQIRTGQRHLEHVDAQPTQPESQDDGDDQPFEPPVIADDPQAEEGEESHRGHEAQMLQDQRMDGADADEHGDA